MKKVKWESVSGKGCNGCGCFYIAEAQFTLSREGRKPEEWVWCQVCMKRYRFGTVGVLAIAMDEALEALQSKKV